MTLFSISAIDYLVLQVAIKFYFLTYQQLHRSNHKQQCKAKLKVLLIKKQLYITNIQKIYSINTQKHNSDYWLFILIDTICKQFQKIQIITRIPIIITIGQTAEMKRRNIYEGETTKKQNIVQIQRQLLTKILAANQGSPTWKILIFDAYNRGVVSSQLKMKDLRDQNITLYLNINDEREQIHGVTIIYLVQPTIQNVDIIANDLLQDMYTTVYVHFSSEPPANILSTLAKKLTSTKKHSVVSRISKIQYSCVGYSSIDSNMCILPTPSEIYNLLSALSCQPIFIYNPSNEQSKNLVQKLKQKYSSISNSFSKQNNIQNSPSSSGISNTSGNYVILYIFNRQSDYFPVLAHGISYASLMQNIYKINKTGSKVTKNKENIELSLQDQIWLNKKNYLISQMKLGELSNQLSSKMIGLSAQQYAQSNQRFKRVQWHLNNAGEMINQAKKRRLNQFYQAELEIYNKSIISKQLKRDMEILLKQAPNNEDKIRLVLIYVMFADSVDEMKQFQAIFPEISNNAKYNELKQKKLKGTVIESASNKYIKKFAKGIWKNLMAGDKKFRITKQLQKIKSSDFTQLIEGGLAVESIGSLPNNIRIQKNIVYCLGGACFHQYANLAQFNPDSIYTGDQIISYREVI